MTKKLYYDDPYIKKFEAEVLLSTEKDGSFLTVLDKTAFFPEEGGQTADTGYIGDARVLDAFEDGGTVYHLTDRLLPLGTVSCSLDFDKRFEKMQLHTAEHILCGIIHKLYGLENVGFHLGEDVVTFDISSPLTKEELLKVEELANEAVFSNIKVEAFFPSASELCGLEYRSKLELTENVRIVKIGDVDSCACCAPHVGYTGEIGNVKILDFEKHRGGLRIIMTAGRRALSDYRLKYENLKEISAMLSIPPHESAAELSRYMKEVEALRAELKSSKISSAERLADSYPETEGNTVLLLSDFDTDELRAFANAYKKKVGGYLVTLSGKEGAYRYLIMKKDQELSTVIRQINKELSGRGGGRGEMVTGTFCSTLQQIKDYFK